MFSLEVPPHYRHWVRTDTESPMTGVKSFSHLSWAGHRGRAVSGGRVQTGRDGHLDLQAGGELLDEVGLVSLIGA